MELLMSKSADLNNSRYDLKQEVIWFDISWKARYDADGN